MPTPEDLAGRVASKFRYGGKKLAMFFQDECTLALGSKGISAMTRHDRFSNPDKLGAPHGAARAGYAPAAAEWISEGAAGSAAGGKERVAPLLTYHYLPPSSSSYKVPIDKKGL